MQNRYGPNESLFSYSLSGKSNLSAPTEPIGGSAAFLKSRPMAAPKPLLGASQNFSKTKQGFFSQTPVKNGLVIKLKKKGAAEKIEVDFNKTMPKFQTVNQNHFPAGEKIKRLDSNASKIKTLKLIKQQINTIKHD